jgi:Glycosyl transferase family 2
MNAEAARVSIALCTWNGARYLAEQLESLLAQEHPVFELIACDDASTDGSWEILNRFAPRFAHSRLVRNPTNLGVHANFQQALALCEGDWIAPCDQDDVWAPHKLGRLLAAAGDATLVYCDSQLVDAAGRSLGERVSDRLPMLDGAHPLAFVFGNCVSGHAALVRRTLLGAALPIPPGVYYDEWLGFVASSLGTLRYVDEPLVQFRQHERNLTQFTSTGSGRRPSPLDMHRSKEPKLAAVASLPSPHQPLIARLHALWRARENDWLSPALTVLMFRHHHELTLPDPRLNRKPAWLYAAKFLWGMRLKMAVWGARQRVRPDRVRHPG